MLQTPLVSQRKGEGERVSIWHSCRRVGGALPLAGGVGLRGPVTTSPRLEVELSPDLLQGEEPLSKTWKEEDSEKIVVALE